MIATMSGGHSFGQKRPPLYHLIKGILREYPSGQVFKEIIQNADDAGATEVKFYLDCRNLQTLTQQLLDYSGGVYCELDQFQGPALMAYNNAPFQKEDWEGIQNLQQSGKAKNPHKVGKFGIGFNSVYHISDLPVIISGDSCGYLDPQEQIWKGESGKGFELQLLQPEVLQPYSTVEGFSTSFHGKTLFRFPLRNKPSQISSELCSIAGIRQLLEVLRAEAKHLLLFLRSVCSIEVIELSPRGNSQTTFKVSISSCDLQQHKLQQKSLVSQVKQAFSENSQYSRIVSEKVQFAIEVKDGSKVSKHQWMVIHRVGSEDRDVLELAKQQYVLPWVGTAYEIGHSTGESGGRIYCFLPLPTEDRAPFSINVNGTFAVSSNRRSLNWESQERQGDNEGKWNRFLVERCLPQCYHQLIQELVKIPSISPDIVYKCWPTVSSVNGTPWEGIMAPLFTAMLTSAHVVFTSASKGKWISLNEAILVPESTVLPDSLKTMLISNGIKLVSLPSTQHGILNEYYNHNITELSASFVRATLKNNRYIYCNLPLNEKLEILNFCLTDMNYADLAGLELIPLANGQFGKFQNRSSQQIIYVCSITIPHNLLPGIDHIMVDHTHHALLGNVSKSGLTQVSTLTVADVAKLVPQSRPYWSDFHLQKFWKWLENHNLSYFHDLSIVPVKNASGIQTLHNLTKQSNIVLVPIYSSHNSNLRTGLEKCGVCFLYMSEFPYLTHHQLPSLMNTFNVHSVLNAMSAAYHIDRVQFSDEESVAIQSFLSTPSLKFNSDQINKICAMAIFSVLKTSSRYSVNKTKGKNKSLLQGDGFNFKIELFPFGPLIFQAGQSLLNKLSGRIQRISGVEYLQQVVFPSINNNTFPKHQLDELMISILNNIHYISMNHQQKKYLLGALSTLPFVMVENGNQKSPSSLFNPNHEILCKLYEGQAVFPSGKFTEYIDELEQCGLRGPDSVDAAMLYEIANDLSLHSYYQQIIQCDSTRLNRVLALFKFLNQHPNMLNSSVTVGRSHLRLLDAICELAKSRALFPVTVDSPRNYPPSLVWKGSMHPTSLVRYTADSVIVLPQTVDHISPYIEPIIIGSEAVFIQNIPSLICNKLMSSNGAKLAAGSVAEHFRHVINRKHGVITPELLQFISIKTYEYLNSNNCQVIFKLNEKWIWIDSCSTFVTSESCAVNNNLTFSLEPFVFVLPRTMKGYKTFFCNHGVSTEITNEQILSVLKDVQSRTFNDLSPINAMVLIENILKWAANHASNDSDLLVPIDPGSIDPTIYPELRPACEVSYTDNDMLLEIAKSSDEEYTLVHPSVAHLAPQLGLRPLSDQLDITEDLFEDAGQHEPLTTRLSNILREYKNGLTIIKEMIQNADDAEASEVNILYDTRQHTEEKLLFKGMADSHGPALVVHNDAKFTDDDFNNITKLAGATKKDKPLKIGKFGVGFCSVYHITDVPSFVSGEWLYIFDPTLTHLKGVVKNENQPGKKVKYMSKFISKTKQLAPYQSLFGFSSAIQYNGTMFRLPFRKHASQISSTTYDDTMVHQLKDDLQKNGDQLLLFLSNVKTIRFLSISKKQDTPCEEVVITKTDIGRNILRIDTTNSHKGDTSTGYWLVSTDKTEQYHIYDKVFQPAVSSVACQLCRTSNDSQYEVVPVDGSVFCYLPLSVPSTGLPVHVSANFAVMSNRSRIWASASSSTPSDAREWWNQQLITTVIPTAYCRLLSMLKDISTNLLNYECHIVLPLGSSVQHPWNSLSVKVCENLLKSPLLYSKFSNEWVSLNKAPLLSHNILSNQHSMPKCVTDSLLIMKLKVVDIPRQCMEKLKSNCKAKINVLDEQQFCSTFLENVSTFFGFWDIRNDVLLCMFKTAACQIAESECSALTDILRTQPCIPSTPNGHQLKLANQLVDSKSDLKQLFDDSNGVFPIPMFMDRQPVHDLMINIGLLTTHLPWNMVLECAKSIPAVYETNKSEALKRVQVLIKAIKKNLELEPKLHKAQKHHSNPYFCELKLTDFLPVACNPDDYFSIWKGNKIAFSSPASMFYPSPSYSYNSYKPFSKIASIKKESWLIGSQKLLVNSVSVGEGGCGEIPSQVLNALGIERFAHLEDVLANYQLLMESLPSGDLDQKKIGAIEYVCRISYEFIEKQLNIKHEAEQQALSGKSNSSTTLQANSSLMALNKFKSKPFVWVESHFVNPEDIAMEWSENGPYLYKIPPILSERKQLINALAIKEKFSIEKMFNCFEEIHRQLGEVILDEKYHKIINAIVSELNKYHPDDFEGIAVEDLILPSILYTLVNASKLSYNDSKWLDPDENTILVHETLRRDIALKLGVKPIRSQFLEKYISTEKNSMFEGTKFGQREDLTQRIQNILRDYPLDGTVLKELLQNADDAKATKMCVILDKRTHGKEQLPSKEWSDLQGPALLVWNNEEFSEKDIQGIQKLGLGSKRDDSESIGQFGIGFNVVYHLTDCLSFISGGKTLCVFDPHCKYAPGATQINPGRRYDNLEKKFWDGMVDMKDSYFQSKPLNNQPLGLENGSLFRFPLRYTREHITNSEIIEHKVLTKVLSADYMEEKLNDWVLQIKDALVFLNHISEFSYYVVDRDKKFNMKCQYKVSMEPSATESRGKMFEGLKQFKNNGNPPSVKPCIFNYQIQLDCTEQERNAATLPSLQSYLGLAKHSPITKRYSEKWFVQQGVGDIDKPSTQKWQYINKVLPKHGIAVPVKAFEGFVGKVFCFLPLQIKSGICVHINGQFVLSSNRRSLWAGSTEGNDEKREWNELLFEAIASSYVHFLIAARAVIVRDEKHASKTKFFDCLKYYYSLFPLWKKSNKDYDFDKTCLKMGKLVFQKLWSSNAEILATLFTDEDLSNKSVTYKVEWNTVKNDSNPFQQLYFQPHLETAEKKRVASLLKCIKMRLTCAPNSIYKNLITDEAIKPAIVTPESVFQFYCSFYQEIFSNACPCLIQDSPFANVETFQEIIIYMMVDVTTEQDTSILMDFPGSPYGYPLLLTADNVIRCFNQDNKVIRSTYYELFPNSLSSFLHEQFLGVHMGSEYFMVSKKIEFTVIENFLKANLSRQLHKQGKLDNNEVCHIELENLERLWNCLTSDKDPLLRVHQENILKTWALTPATDGCLYSTNSDILPILPLTDYTESKSFKIFSGLGLPTIDKSINCNICLKTCAIYFPSITSYDKVLSILYHLHQEQHIFDSISECSMDIKSIFKYFQKTGFIHNYQLKNQILSLPLFKPKQGSLTSLLDKKVYLWPLNRDFCEAGYNKWAPAESVVFLDYWGDWRQLTNDITVIGKSMEEKRIYLDLILPCFSRLSSGERKQHLEYILEHIYPIVKNSSEMLGNNEHVRQQRQEAQAFLNELRALKCIECPGSSQLKPVSDFSDHTSDIFNTFSDAFVFLPDEYQDKKWFQFFCDLGLQTSISAENFINFCFRVEERTHNKSLTEASSVLLKYLFDKGRKASWSDYLLSKISNICFVTVADVPHLSWIKAPCSSLLEINDVIKLTRLNQSVLLKYAPLVWTVKPVFEQPELNEEESIWDREAFLEKLSVTQPSVEDIVNNLFTISNSRLANLELFDNYDSSLVCSYHDKFSLAMQCLPSIKLSLLNVVSQCLDELQKNLKCFEELVLKLKNCACVPVSAKPLADGNSNPTHVVLVRPIQVVRILGQGDDHLKPYIHELPNCLANYSAALKLLGVQDNINIVHLQYVLNMIHLKLNGGRTDDPNEIGKIRKSISKLNELMSKEDYSKKEAAKHLDPLYLPFSLGKHWSLKPSNNLIFVDSARHQFRNPKNFNLVETKYSLFTIPPTPGNVQDRSGIGFNMLNERNFCKLLPKEVRPLQLSLHSYEQRLDVGSVTMGDNIAIACLNKSKKFTVEHVEMPLVLQKMLTYIYMYETKLVDSEPFVQTFLGIMRNINLVSMKGLQASLYLTNENIGTLTSPKFVLEKGDGGIYEYTLYVDESQDGNGQFLNELSRSLLMEIAKITETNLTTYFKMIDPIKSFFEVRTSEDLKVFVNSYEIQLTLTDNDENNELEDVSLIPVAGKKIPEEFVCRLDNSITNIFNPQEWVAYEVAEEEFVWAMVLYPTHGGNVTTKLDRYNIMVNDEEDGKEVSVVDIYKIISKVVHEDEVFEQALVPLGESNDDDAESQIRLIRGSQTILAMKEKICADLRRISNLADETEKRKAIKRLYLLYHPDKVSSNKDMFEQAFQFLLRQIERLAQGLPLEDPKNSDESNAEAGYEPSQQWSARFNQWSSYVPRHSNRSSSRVQQATSRSNFDFTEYQPKPDHNESDRWLKQAHTDFKAMNILLNVTRERGDQESVVCQVLFLAHEAIEKSLKAGMYKLVGLNPEFLKHHELVYHARSICSLRSNANTLRSSIGTVSLESIASWMTPFYLDSRFPNRHCKYTAPVDVYSIDCANKAADFAEITINFIDSL